MNDLVEISNDQVVTSSVDVAKNFGREHHNVIKSIDSLKKDVVNFNEMFYKKNGRDSYGRFRNEYLMNRDGFTLLAMGFTGKKALDFKLKYIAAFNEMEKQLNEKLPSNYKEALIDLVEQIEENERLETNNLMLEQQVTEMKPKADYADIILKSKSIMTITQISKDYGMSGQAMNKLLNDLGVQYKQSGQWLLYAKHHGKGYTHSDTQEYTRKDGTKGTRLLTKWTQKGRLFLYNLLKDIEVIPLIEKES